MKKLLLRSILTLSLVAAGCGAPSSRRVLVERQNSSPNNQSFTLNENLEPVVAPASAFEAELNRLREQGSGDVADLHQETVERNNRTTFEERPESDRLDFRNMQTTFLQNGQIQATFDVVYFVEGEERAERVEFISPETILGDEFSFTATQGFSLREIVLKGACIDGYQTCSHLVLEPAYFLNDMKVGRHFVAYRPTEEQIQLRVEEQAEETDTEVVEEGSVNLTPAPTPTVAPVAPSGEEETEIELRSEAPEVMSVAPSAPEAPEVEEESIVLNVGEPDNNSFERQAPELSELQASDVLPAEIDTSSPDPVEVLEESPEISDISAEEALNPVAPEISADTEVTSDRVAPAMPPAPDVGDEFHLEDQIAQDKAPELVSPPAVEESPDVSVGQVQDPVVRAPRPADLGPPPEISAMLAPEIADTAPAPQPEVSLDAPDMTEPPEVELETELSVTEDTGAIQLSAPEAPPVPSEDTLEIVSEDPPPAPPDQEVEDAVEEEITLSVAEEEASDLAVAVSLRPEIRPDREIELRVAEEVEESPDAEAHDPEVTVASGHYFIGSVDDRDGDVEVFYNLNSGQAYPIHLQPTPVENELLSDVLNKSYNHARGSYINGSLVNAEQLPREIEGAVVNPGRANHQWGSGLSIDFIQYVASRYSRMENGTPFCINNISLENGGNSPSHSSHENGLDIDISYPSSSNRCTSRRDFLVPWSDLSAEDSEFLERNWEFLKFILVDDEVKNRITIIFSDLNFMKSLCRWAQGADKEQSHIESILDKLYHQRNHHHHYHIRMTCNQQNNGCTPQNSYTRPRNRVSPVTCE